MQIHYWPIELQSHLKNKFYYEKETGLVKHCNIQGSRAKAGAPVGTVYPNGQILVNVPWKGRQWMIPVHKLAVFLETGKQFKKVGFKDGNKSNTKFDNMVGLGEITEEPTENRELAASLLKAAQDKMMASRLKAHDLVAAESLEAAFNNAKNRLESEKKELVTDTVKTINVGYKTGEELWAEIAAEELEFKKAYQVTAYGRAETLLTIKLEREQNRLVAEAGLYTGAKWFEMQDHYDRWSPVLAFTLADYVIGQTVSIDESEPKWKHDFYYSCRILKNVEKGIITRDQVDTLLSKYTWQGQEYRLPDFISQLGADFVSSVKLLELEHRTTREAELEFLHYCARHGLKWRVEAVATETI